MTRLLRHFVWVIALLVMAQGAFAQESSIGARADAELPSLVELYKHLHANPELSGAERATSARIAKELRAAGYEVTENVGGFGVVAVLKNGDGPTVMVRADMDALPITEDTGAAYASRVRAQGSAGEEVGVMHACGHDIHMTYFVGTARLLAAQASEWQGTLLLVAQPAEERAAGARAMINDGLFERFPRPDYALALHVDAGLIAGKVGFVEGPFNAAVDSIDIIVYGRGGHGAYPHNTIDPVVMAAKIVLELQTIVSREINPSEAAVITAGVIRGGTTRNVIPNEVTLELTVRTRSAAVREQVLAAITRVSKGVTRTAGMPEDRLAKVVVDDVMRTPVVYNDPQLVRTTTAAMRRALGEDKVVHRAPTMGGEDFAYYGDVSPKIPIFMYRLGSVPQSMWRLHLSEDKVLPGLHSAAYLPDAEPTIRTGVVSMVSAVQSLLPRN